MALHTNCGGRHRMPAPLCATLMRLSIIAANSASMAGAWCGGDGGSDDVCRSTIDSAMRAAHPRHASLPLLRMAHIADSALRRICGLVTLEFCMRVVRCCASASPAWMNQRARDPCGLSELWRLFAVTHFLSVSSRAGLDRSPTQHLHRVAFRVLALRRVLLLCYCCGACVRGSALPSAVIVCQVWFALTR